MFAIIRILLKTPPVFLQQGKTNVRLGARWSDQALSSIIRHNPNYLSLLIRCENPSCSISTLYESASWRKVRNNQETRKENDEWESVDNNALLGAFCHNNISYGRYKLFYNIFRKLAIFLNLFLFSLADKQREKAGDRNSHNGAKLITRTDYCKNWIDQKVKKYRRDFLFSIMFFFISLLSLVVKLHPKESKLSPIIKTRSTNVL